MTKLDKLYNIPEFNGQQYIKDLIESQIAQNNHDKEVVKEFINKVISRVDNYDLVEDTQRNLLKEAYKDMFGENYDL